MNCGEAHYIDNSDTGWTSAFGSAVSSFPVVGGLFGGMVSTSQSIEQLQCIPGNQYDVRSGYSGENRLIIIALVLVLVYFLVPLFKK